MGRAPVSGGPPGEDSLERPVYDGPVILVLGLTEFLHGGLKLSISGYAQACVGRCELGPRTT
jgi:hypothetical protein